MATKIDPPADFLRRFSYPLWESLKLHLIEPLWIVEGVHQGFSYTVLELSHFHALWPGRMRDVSIFFIVKLPNKSSRWRITRKPDGYRVSVDEGHVYLTQLGKQPRVRDWPHLLDLTVNMASTLVERSGSPATGSEEERVWNVSDRQWVLFGSIAIGIIPILVIGMFFSELAGYQRYGYVRQCSYPADYAKLLTGENAWLYLSLLALPIPVALKMCFTIYRYMYRKYFMLRYSVDAILLTSVSFLAIYLAFTVPVWVGHLEDGTKIPCYSNIPNRKASNSQNE